MLNSYQIISWLHYWMLKWYSYDTKIFQKPIIMYTHLHSRIHISWYLARTNKGVVVFPICCSTSMCSNSSSIRKLISEWTYCEIFQLETTVLRVQVQFRDELEGSNHLQPPLKLASPSSTDSSGHNNNIFDSLWHQVVKIFMNYPTIIEKITVILILYVLVWAFFCLGDCDKCHLSLFLVSGPY
jgi:hypothetical protein